ncbi:MAG: hypothetical protein LBP81_06390 [Treponema sp.]|nr:hypothetical protein [Treponema sp.]
MLSLSFERHIETMFKLLNAHRPFGTFSCLIHSNSMRRSYAGLTLFEEHDTFLIMNWTLAFFAHHYHHVFVQPPESDA